MRWLTGAIELPSPVISVVIPWVILLAARLSTRTLYSDCPSMSMKPGVITSREASMRRRARAVPSCPPTARPRRAGAVHHPSAGEQQLAVEAGGRRRARGGGDGGGCGGCGDGGKLGERGENGENGKRDDRSTGASESRRAGAGMEHGHLRESAGILCRAEGGRGEPGGAASGFRGRPEEARVQADQLDAEGSGQPQVRSVVGGQASLLGEQDNCREVDLQLAPSEARKAGMRGQQLRSLLGVPPQLLPAGVRDFVAQKGGCCRRFAADLIGDEPTLRLVEEHRADSRGVDDLQPGHGSRRVGASRSARIIYN